MLKGYDCASVQMTTVGGTLEYDEVRQFISARYVCPPEAMHRLLEDPMHRRLHVIKRLLVHLPGEEVLFFKEGQEEEMGERKKSSLLTAWFELNRRDPEARKYLYSEIPNVYVDVTFVNPNGERGFLWTLLLHFEAEAERRCVRHLEYIFQQHGMSLRDFPNMPHPKSDVGLDDVGEGVAEIDDEVTRRAQDSVEKLTQSQRAVYDAVQHALDDLTEKQRYLFVDGAGGSGKTFLYNCRIDKMRVRKEKVVAIAWTGIAANLLRGIRTVHSTFKLPIPLTETSTSAIKANSGQADYLRSASLIIWDEISVALGNAMRVIGLLLRDITRLPSPFGGKVVLVRGDFRQCLPVASTTAEPSPWSPL